MTASERAERMEESIPNMRALGAPQGIIDAAHTTIEVLREVAKREAEARRKYGAASSRRRRSCSSRRTFSR